MAVSIVPTIVVAGAAQAITLQLAGAETFDTTLLYKNGGGIIGGKLTVSGTDERYFFVRNKLDTDQQSLYDSWQDSAEPSAMVHQISNALADNLQNNLSAMNLNNIYNAIRPRLA